MSDSNIYRVVASDIDLQDDLHDRAEMIAVISTLAIGSCIGMYYYGQAIKAPTEALDYTMKGLYTFWGLEIGHEVHQAVKAINEKIEKYKHGKAM